MYAVWATSVGTIPGKWPWLSFRNDESLETAAIVTNESLEGSNSFCCPTLEPRNFLSSETSVKKKNTSTNNQYKW